jgi:uncharacterized membrane protein
MAIGWIIGIVLAIICIIACCRSFYGKARFYCNMWDVAGSAILTIAVIVAIAAVYKAPPSDHYSFYYDSYNNIHQVLHRAPKAEIGGFHWLYVVLPLMIIYHGVIAFMSNASSPADAFCIWISRTTLTAVLVIFAILAMMSGSTKQRDDERDGEYIMRSLSAKVTSAAILGAIGWFAGRLVNDGKIERDDYIDVKSHPVRHGYRPYPGSPGFEPVAAPQVEYRSADSVFTYRWKVDGQEFRGQKTCRDEHALRQHVEGLGGELLEVING